MLLKIISTTDGQYVGKHVEYNEATKTLTLPSGVSFTVIEEIIAEEKYTLKNSNYTINLITTI